MPCGYGPRHQSYRVLEVLTRLYDVTLLVINEKNDVNDVELAFDTLQQQMPRLSTISIWRTAQYLREDVGKYRLRQLVNRFDLMLLDHASMAEYLHPGYRGIVIYHSHKDEKNDDAVISKQGRQWLSRLRLSPPRFDPEVFLLQRADIVLCEGEYEENPYSPLTRQSPTNIPFAFNERLLQDFGRLSPKPDQLKLLFVSDSSHDVIRKPLERFLTLHWTAIRRCFPSLILEIALPSDHTIDPALTRAERNIKLVSFNGSWKRWSEQTCLFVNPVRHPTGISQTLNAMAAGFPVLAPTILKRSLPPEMPLLAMDSVDDAVENIARASVDRLLWQRSITARADLQESCSINRLGSVLFDSLEQATSNRRVPRTTNGFQD